MMTVDPQRGHRERSDDARHRARLDAHQGGPRRPGPRTAGERQPRLGEPVRRPGLDVLARRRLGGPAGVRRGPARRRRAAATACARPRSGPSGVSAMMHGYLAFDAAGELLVPFRTWRNTSTGPAAAELTELFGLQHPAALVDRPPAPGDARRRAARPAGALPHHARRATCTGSSPAARCSASATRRACSRSTRRPRPTTRAMLAAYPGPTSSRCCPRSCSRARRPGA